MAKVLHCTAYNTTLTTSLTRYVPLSQGGVLMNATEANAQIIYRAGGVVSQLVVNISANTITAATTVRTRINAANGSVLISIGSSATGVFEDVSNTDTITAGDKLDYRIITGGTGTSITIKNIISSYAATTNSYQRLTVTTSAFSTASVSRFQYIAGRSDVNATETNRDYLIKTAGTLKHLMSYISTNARASSATTIDIRINAASGTQTFSVPASTTGFFEDSTNTDAVAVDDLINYRVTTGAGTGNFTCATISVALETTNSKFALPTHHDAATTTLTTTIKYATLGNSPGYLYTTESDAQAKIKFGFTASFLSINLSTFTGGDTITFRLRINGADGNSVISATGSGEWTDTTHTDTIAVDDLVNYSGITSTSTSAITFASIHGETAASGSSIKTFDGLAVASVKTVDGLAIASVKNYNGLA